MKLGALAAAFAVTLGGCCLSEIHGIATTGSSGGESSTGATNSGTAAGSGTAGSSSGATSGGATSGTSGSTTGALPPAVLLDAGANTIFGPVAMAAIPDGGNEVARLVYAEGDGGQFGIMLETLDALGRPLGAALQLATTSDYPGHEDAYGNPTPLDYPLAPPDVTVSDDGTTTTVCWEDFSMISNPAAPEMCLSDAGVLSVRCASVPDDGSSPDASYSNCGTSPRLVFNPTDASTQLFFLEPTELTHEVGGYVSRALTEWAVGQPPSVNQIVSDAGEAVVATPLPSGRDGVVFSNLVGTQGLWFASTGFADAGYLMTESLLVDPGYQILDGSGSGEARSFAAAGEPSGGTAAILEFNGGELLGFIWQADAPRSPPGKFQVPSPEPPEGAIAVGICPAGYVYLATTIRGHVLFAAGSFDGGVGPGSSRYLELPNFDQTPLLQEIDNSTVTWPATSMALAPAPGGKLLLAISNPWQVAVYAEDCP
jgi:hypothetical protein